MGSKKMTSLEKNKFEEGRSLKVLQLLFPTKYKEAILSDAPDIINKKLSIGVEVTNSMNQVVQEGHAKIGDFSGKEPTELTKRNLAQIGSEGINAFLFPTGKVYGTFTHWGNCHDLIHAYLSKTETLNKTHFSIFSENNLFIIAWMIDCDELESGIEYFINDPNDFFIGEDPSKYIFFDYVYILTEGLLVEIDIGKAVVNKHQIGRTQMDNISHSAFRDVFGVSRTEYYGR